MIKNSSPPQYSAVGLHILDPKDTRGHKSEYITLVQKKALLCYLPDGPGLALDVGCGYGRLTSFIVQKGWQVIGVDPDENLIEYAMVHYPGAEYRVGGLPNLPVSEGSIGMLLIHNLLRPLLLMGGLGKIKGVGRFLSPKATIVVIDNIREGHPDYLPETQIIDLFKAEGLCLEKRIPIRAGRWWPLYFIRYGLIPHSWFESIAEYELALRARNNKIPVRQYYNVLYIFTKG
jgi:SAM-dependent methyltransferase